MGKVVIDGDGGDRWGRCSYEVPGSQCLVQCTLTHAEPEAEQKVAHYLFLQKWLFFKFFDNVNQVFQAFHFKEPSWLPLK